MLHHSTIKGFQLVSSIRTTKLYCAPSPSAAIFRARRHHFATTVPPQQPINGVQQQVPPPPQPFQQKPQWKGAFATQHRSAPNPSVSNEANDAYRAAKGKLLVKNNIENSFKAKEAKLQEMSETLDKSQALLKDQFFRRIDFRPALQQSTHAQQKQFSNPDFDLISQDRNVKFPTGFVTLGALIIFCSYTATLFWDFHYDFKEQEIALNKKKSAV